MSFALRLKRTLINASLVIKSTPGGDGNVDPAKPRGNRFPGRGRHTRGRGGGRPYGRFRSEKVSLGVLGFMMMNNCVAQAARR